MSINETATASGVNEIRLIAMRCLEANQGWLFGLPGDGIFAIFESAIGAVQCALDLQGELKARPQLANLKLRIGIHLGEVLFENDQPFGEALAIAARLESLADPGGILVSSSVMETVSARVSATFEERGVPKLKNIPRRIMTFAVLPPPARSSVDQTVSDLPSLDRTTRLDSGFLKEFRKAQIANQAAGQAASEASAPLEQSPHPPDPAAGVAPAQDEQQPSAVIGPLASDTPPAPAELPPEPAPSVPTQDAANPEPEPNTDTVTGAANASAAPASHQVPEDQPLSPDEFEHHSESQHQPAEPDPVGYDLGLLYQPDEFIADAPGSSDSAAPIADPLPETPAPNLTAEPGISPPAAALSRESVRQLTAALAIHLGPVSRVIVNRNLDNVLTPYELAARLEDFIPDHDEKLLFRIRASQICSDLPKS